MKNDGVARVLKNRAVFYAQALKSAKEVGAFTFTSNAVARAVVAPIERKGKPLRVLEAGAGTGALTRAIVERLGEGDTLDVFEINPEFLKVLREEFSTSKAPVIEIHDRDIEDLPKVEYDVIVSSLPLLNFPADKVKRVFQALLAHLSPSGTLSYYDYWAKEVRSVMTPGSEGRRMKEVLKITKEFLDGHEYCRKVIPWNLPPANVHYLRKSL